MCVNLEIIQAFKSVLNSAILMSESDIEFHLIIDDFFKPGLESLVYYIRQFTDFKTILKIIYSQVFGTARNRKKSG